MQLVEQHRIDRHDPRCAALDAAAFASKNLYNAALYLTRQAYIKDHTVIGYAALDKFMQPSNEYQALPAKVAQWVLKQVTATWTSYFAACAAWEADASRFLGHPKLPKYLKKQGRNLLTYTEQAISRAPKNTGWVVPSGVDIRVATKLPYESITQVRIVPKATHYVVEVVYEREPVPAAVDSALHASVDLGVNNLATIASDKPGFVPRIVNGHPVKSINQFYNKRRGALQSRLGHPGTTAQLERLTVHRTRQIDHYLHTASRRIIDLLVAEGIGALVIGKNPFWKQEVNLGKRNNQNFVSIPHARFIDMLIYKAEWVGIQVNVTEESYTSKASFLDGDSLPVYDASRQETTVFSGRRLKRGLYQAASGRRLNADVNGAYNILRTALPDAFGKGIAGAAVHPVRLAVRTKPAA